MTTLTRPSRGRLQELSQSAYVQLSAIALLAPALVIISVILAGPFVYVLWRSVSSEAGGVTVDNFAWLFSGDFRTVLITTLIIGVGSVVVELCAAIPLALLLNQDVLGRGAARALMTVPWAVPTIAVATAFLWLADPYYGLFNQVLQAMGILSGPLAILGDPDLALIAVTFAHAWKGFPLVFIMLLASLQSHDAELSEAAQVDGAWRLAQFRFVIFPQWRSTIALAAVFSSVYNFCLFDITFLLTGGGPAGATTTLPLLLYNQQFGGAPDPGRAAAVGVTLCVASALAVSVLFAATAWSRRRRGVR